MKSYEEILKMFNLEDEKVYFNNKGMADAKNVIIEEDYTFSECGGMLYGSEVFVLYNNYSNNEIDSYNIDIYTIK